MDSGQLIRNVAKTLNDPEHVRWKIEDLVAYLNAGCMEVCRVRPEASETSVVLNLTQGTRQSIRPTDLQLIRIIRNVPSGRAVRMVATEMLDAVLPSWHSAPRADDVREYGWDQREPRVFWVYPPARETSKLECSVSKRPAPISVPANPANPVYDPFPLPDRYAQAVEGWMLYRAYMQDTGAGSMQKAQTWSQYFYHSLGVGVQGRTENEPGNDV